MPSPGQAVYVHFDAGRIAGQRRRGRWIRRYRMHILKQEYQRRYDKDGQENDVLDGKRLWRLTLEHVGSDWLSVIGDWGAAPPASQFLWPPNIRADLP